MSIILLNEIVVCNTQQETLEADKLVLETEIASLQEQINTKKAELQLKIQAIAKCESDCLYLQSKVI